MISPRSFAALAVIAASLSTSAHAATLLTGGSETAPDSFFGIEVTIGTKFTPSEALDLTALGIWDAGSDGLPASLQVGVWEQSTGTLLASVTISSADALDTSVTVEGGQWRYETLGATVTLASGTSYIMGFHYTEEIDPADILLLSYPTIGSSGLVSLTDEYYYNYSPELAFPTESSAAGAFYPAMANAQFTVSAVPEPGSTLLAALGAIGLLRRRRGM